MIPSRESIAGTAGMVLLLAAALWYAGDPDMQHWPLAAFSAGGASRPEMPEISVSHLDWSADGRTLLSHSRGVVEGAESLTLHTLGPTLLQNPVDLGGLAICAVALAPDGRHLAVGTIAGALCWIDSDSFETTTLIELPGGLFFTSVAVSSDSCRVAAASNSGMISVCDPLRRTVVELEADRQSSVCDLRLSPDGRRLLTARADGSIALWDFDSGKARQSFAGHAQPAQCAAFLPGGERIISGGLDDSVRIWDIASGREEWRGEFGLNGVRALDVSPDGTTAAWGGFDHRIVVWDLQRRCRKFEFRTPAVFVATLKFSLDGRTLAAAGFESKIRLYDVETGNELPGIDLAGGP